MERLALGIEGNTLGPISVMHATHYVMNYS